MHPLDLLALEKVNLDPLTETYHIGFYLEYLAKWPHLCRVIVGRDGDVEAYSKSFAFLSDELGVKWGWTGESLRTLGARECVRRAGRQEKLVMMVVAKG